MKEDLEKRPLKRGFKVAITVLISVVLLGMTICTGSLLRNQEIDPSQLQTVRCQVTKITSHSLARASSVVHTYYADYQGKQYEIHNVKGRIPQKGDTIDVYLYQGKMYANIEGIRTNTPIGKIYFVFLYATYISVWPMITQIVLLKKEHNATK